jgi:hypothetical protein
MERDKDWKAWREDYLVQTKKLKDCLKECADDLEALLKYFYTEEMLHHSVIVRKFYRDMAPVRRARELLNEGT